MGKALNSAVFPNMQGGPLEHTIAAKAVAFKEAAMDEFVQYQEQVVANAKALATTLHEGGLRLVSGGTDNHMTLVDVTPIGISGKQAEESLGKANIVINRNAIPFDTKPPRQASGIRLGTPAVTSRGMKVREATTIGKLILKVLTNIEDPSVEEKVKQEILELTSRFPVPGITS
jgi:glycine hydroxymethyltransferase